MGRGLGRGVSRGDGLLRLRKGILRLVRGALRGRLRRRGDFIGIGIMGMVEGVIGIGGGMIEIMRGAVGIAMGIVDARGATSAITSLLSTPGKCECNSCVLIHGSNA